MATAATVRAWMAEQGRPQTRGRLKDEITDEWDAAHPDDPYQSHNPPSSFISETEMDEFFPGADDGFTETDLQETKPRAPARASARAKPAGKRIRGLLGISGSNAKGKSKKPPRVDTGDFWGSVWRGGAKLATPLPPMYRVLRVQSVVAGPLLEDAVKGTVIDTFAQPLARLANTGKTANALLGPPVIIGLMAVHETQQAARGQEPNPLFLAVAGEALRSSLMALLDIGGPKFEEAMERERDQEERLGMSVDAFMQFLFMPRAATPEQQDAEEAIFRRIVHPAEPATM